MKHRGIVTMKKLVRGVTKFQQEVFVQNKELFDKLATGQAPHTLFITCSDSRISPNLLTQTEPGEIFILRNAGNIVPAHGSGPSGEAATIEYAVAALGVSDVVICGHSLCGAMKGLLDPASLEHLPAVKAWLSHADATRAILREIYHGSTGEDLLNIAIQENVLVQLENLKTLPSVAARLASGRLRLHAWVYKIESGDVFVHNADTGQFLPVGDRPVGTVGGPRPAFAQRTLPSDKFVSSGP
jgi:carbonic anhydrase